jgi:hypothetical protein
MAGSVRPRISTEIYELAIKAAAASCLPTSHWLLEAIREKAAREGFEIVNGSVIYLDVQANGFKPNQPSLVKSEM